jgi:hypothetical protein
MGVEVNWASATVRPILYAAHFSVLQAPDVIVDRPTDWDMLKVIGPKLIKGVTLDLNTFGAAKTLAIEADEAVITTVTVTANGRQQISCPVTPFQASLVRVNPTGSGTCLIYGAEWMSDALPLSLLQWDGRPLDLGAFGYTIHFDGYVALASTASVTLTLTIDGLPHVYTIPSTNGVIRKVYVPFTPVKGLLTRYTLDSTTPFQVYKNETTLRVFAWGSGEIMTVHPFGGDNEDPQART